MIKKLLYVLAGALALSTIVACNRHKKADDPLAETGRTQRTENLLANMRLQADSAGYMYGHQDDTAYGIGWVGDSCRSDVNNVCGDFPAVIGFDLGHIELGDERNLDGVPFDHMRQLIFQQYERGGVVTLSWHVNNPLTYEEGMTFGGTSWIADSTKLHDIEQTTMREVLKEGATHDRLVAWVDSVAQFLNSLETLYGVKVPVVFRPWHEHTGSWFWWGRDYCTPDEYRQLWTLVADRFKKNNVTNALLAYSPGGVSTPEEYMERYPGDDLIDILGFDNYCFMRSVDDVESLKHFVEEIQHQLDYVCALAKEHDKVAAFTETGFEGIPYASWWTECLAQALGDYPIAYVLTWRNAHDKPGHFYAPYPGHQSSDDFVAFYNLPRTLFVHDINGIYLKK